MDKISKIEKICDLLYELNKVSKESEIGFISCDVADYKKSAVLFLERSVFEKVFENANSQGMVSTEKHDNKYNKKTLFLNEVKVFCLVEK